VVMAVVMTMVMVIIMMMHGRVETRKLDTEQCKCKIVGQNNNFSARHLKVDNGIMSGNKSDMYYLKTTPANLL